MTFTPNDNYDQAGNPMVTLISSPNHCPQCVSAKSLLDQRAIAYRSLTLEKDITREEYADIGATSRMFPVVFYGDREIIGQENLMKLVLELKKPA